MRSELPAMAAFAGGSLWLSSATPAGLLAGVTLIALATTLAVAFLSHHLSEEPGSRVRARRRSGRGPADGPVPRRADVVRAGA